MTTETNAERLERIKSEWNGDDILCVADNDWLVQQAERVQELETVHLGQQVVIQSLRNKNVDLREALQSACNSLNADIEDYL